MVQIINSLLQNSDLKLKKVVKTTRPFRYDLSQIPYNYTEKVINRFKGSDLLDRVPEEVWVEVCDTIQEAVIKIISNKKKGVAWHPIGTGLCIAYCLEKQILYSDFEQGPK